MRRNVLVPRVTSIYFVVTFPKGTGTGGTTLVSELIDTLIRAEVSCVSGSCSRNPRYVTPKCSISHILREDKLLLGPPRPWTVRKKESLTRTKIIVEESEGRNASEGKNAPLTISIVEENGPETLQGSLPDAFVQRVHSPFPPDNVAKEFFSPNQCSFSLLLDVGTLPG